MSNTDFDRLPDETKRRQFIRFDSTFTSGNLIEVIVLVAGMFAAYSALKEGQATQKVEIDQVKATAIADKSSTKESLSEIKGDVKEIQRTLTQVSQQLAVIEAKQPKGKP